MQQRSEVERRASTGRATGFDGGRPGGRESSRKEDVLVQNNSFSDFNSNNYSRTLFGIFGRYTLDVILSNPGHTCLCFQDDHSRP